MVKENKSVNYIANKLFKKYQANVKKSLNRQFGVKSVFELAAKIEQSSMISYIDNNRINIWLVKQVLEQEYTRILVQANVLTSGDKEKQRKLLIRLNSLKVFSQYVNKRKQKLTA